MGLALEKLGSCNCIYICPQCSSPQPITLWAFELWHSPSPLYLMYKTCLTLNKGFPSGSAGKESAWDAGDEASVHGLGRFPGEGHGNPFQYSCLENLMDRGACWAPWGHKELHTTEVTEHTCTTLNKYIKMKVKLLSRVRLFVTPWTVAYQASPSMGFSRQEYWSGLPFPSPGDLPDPGIEPGSPTL